MFTWDELKTAELGHPFEIKALKSCCKAIYGGVAWPGQREGFAVVLAMDKQPHLDSYDIYLLDEYESFDTRELIRKCVALEVKYPSQRWIGDRNNDAADRFIREINAETGPEGTAHRFHVCPSRLMEMEHLYPYVLAELKRLLDPGHRMLYLKTSKVLDYLAQIEPSEIHTVERGAYPAIEALAIAVCEMRQWARLSDMVPEQEDMRLAESYATPSNF